MEIKLLNPNYKNDIEFYKQFLSGNLINNNKYVSNNKVNISDIPSFPIYFPSEHKRREDFLLAVKIISESYLKNTADIFENELFWHSLLCLYKRDFILKNYPEVKTSYEKFKRIVIKNFNWENYIYKSVLSAKYVTNHTDVFSEQERYYNLILDNLDIFNYIIKYPIFRNGLFLIKILDIIDQENLSNTLKANVTGSKADGRDLRRGRQIIYEFNKSYPILFSPMLDYSELKKYFMEFLSYYE